MTQGTTKGVPIDTDPTMALNSNQVVPSQAAVVTYVGSQLSSKISGTATQYNVIVGATANTITSVGPGTAGQILRSGGNAANPSYSTSTYPATNAVNTLLYASAANVMSALPTANSGVLTTSTSGVPSIDTTNFQVLTTGVQIKGNNTNTAPPAGFIGEQIKSSIAFASGVTLTPSGTNVNITSISLTPGIWNVDILGIMTATSSGTVSGGTFSIVTTSATAGTNGDNSTSGPGPVYNISNVTHPISGYRLVLNATTTVYMTAYAAFTSGTYIGYGTIRATRVG